MIVSNKGQDTEIPLSRVVSITVKKSTLDAVRLESTLVFDLECGRIVTVSRIPSSKVSELKSAILAPS